MPPTTIIVSSFKILQGIHIMQFKNGPETSEDRGLEEEEECTETCRRMRKRHDEKSFDNGGHGIR